MPFCTRPVYFRVVLFSIPCFGLFINLLFIDQKKKKKKLSMQTQHMAYCCILLFMYFLLNISVLHHSFLFRCNKICIYKYIHTHAHIHLQTMINKLSIHSASKFKKTYLKHSRIHSLNTQLVRIWNLKAC